MAATQQALCCECGQLRTFRRVLRNHREENWWLKRPIDRDWHRETGELKCSACGTITVHALLHRDGDQLQNHAERLHRMATGWTYTGFSTADHQRVREAWRQGLPQNPDLRHLWWISDERKARNAGQSHFPAICKVLVPVPELTPEQDTSYRRDELVAPERFHDVDREDPETGLWWYAQDCVDCLRRANATALQEKRKKLADKLIEYAGRVSNMDPATVLALAQQFDDAESSDE